MVKWCSYCRKHVQVRVEKNEDRTTPQTLFVYYCLDCNRFIKSELKVSKSLREVWDWKEKVYEETKDLSLEETIANFKKTSKDICKKYGLKLKKRHPVKKREKKGKLGPQFKKDIKESLKSGKPKVVWKGKKGRTAVTKQK